MEQLEATEGAARLPRRCVLPDSSVWWGRMVGWVVELPSDKFASVSVGGIIWFSL